MVNLEICETMMTRRMRVLLLINKGSPDIGINGRDQKHPQDSGISDFLPPRRSQTSTEQPKKCTSAGRRRLKRRQINPTENSDDVEIHENPIHKLFQLYHTNKLYLVRASSVIIVPIIRREIKLMTAVCILNQSQSIGPSFKES
jgi:hypothetical protein